MKAASFIPGLRKVKLPHRLPPVFKGIFVFIFLVLFSGISHGSTLPVFQFLSPLTEKINSPTSIAIGPQGRVYVANVNSNRILVLTQQGQHIDTIKSLADPISIAVDDVGRIYVGNERKGNVEVFDSNLTKLHKLGFQDDEFIQPNDIAIDNTIGNVFVADKKKNIVRIYDAKGAFLRNLGEPGNGNGQFSSPVSVAIDANAEEIIVLDRGLIKTSGGMMGSWVPGARIQFFSLDGTFLRSFNKYGSNVGDLVRPQRLEVDEQGRIFVTDSFQNIVLVYDNDGNYLDAIFDLDNPLRTPLGLVLDRNNKLYVASRMQKQVEVYGIDDFVDMTVSPLSLSLTGREGETASSSQSITIQNTGKKSISWSAVAGDSWIILSDREGVVDINQDEIFSVNADMTDLTPGDYTGNISIYSGDEETAIVKVSLRVEPAPVLSATPLVLEFITEVNQTPLPQSVTIVNEGSLPLGWNLAADQSWIVVKSQGSTLAQDSNTTAFVYPDVQTLEPGTYTGIVTVTAEGAVGSPAAIVVALTVTEATGTPGKGKDKYKDSDEDGIPDFVESCPNDPDKVEPGICGCGKADEDTNENDVMDCLEKKKGKILFPIKTKDGRIIILQL